MQCSAKDISRCPQQPGVGPGSAPPDPGGSQSSRGPGRATRSRGASRASRTLPSEGTACPLPDLPRPGAPTPGPPPPLRNRAAPEAAALLAGAPSARGGEPFPRFPSPPAGPQKGRGAPSSGRQPHPAPLRRRRPQEDRRAAGAQVGACKPKPGASPGRPAGPPAGRSPTPSPARLSMCKLQAPPGLQFPPRTTPPPPQRKRLSPASQPSRAVTPPRRDRPGQASRFCARARRRRRRRWRSGPAAGWARGPAGWASPFRPQNRFPGQRSRPTAAGSMRATPVRLQAALRAAGAAESESHGCPSCAPAVGRAAPEALGLLRAGSRKRRRPTLPANRTRAAGGTTAAEARGEPWGSGGPACRTGERVETPLARGCRGGGKRFPGNRLCCPSSSPALCR